MDIDEDDVLSSNRAGPSSAATSSGWNVQVDYDSLTDDLKEVGKKTLFTFIKYHYDHKLEFSRLI
jgi:hypothetical protein